ncbi:hypothetical protein OIU84_008019 [Salix udensis]|uniref:Uncharacterized protein n=1 Tax=Salix udensis TaxID=889485 RepID=A0AAD6JUA7_9ROSI|nr:hypothetical protein OIU84_008019 [Salix udensis]
MEENRLDCVLVPSGLSVMGIYHIWLLYTIFRYPTRTVVGINSETRLQWVHAIMTDPMKNGVLAVQTIRNNIMASTLLATTAITLSSLIGVFVSSTSNSDSSASQIVYGNKSSIMQSIKYFSILLCFLVAFLCFVQSIRYYAHCSFLVTVPISKDKKGFYRVCFKKPESREFLLVPWIASFLPVISPVFCGSLGPYPCLRAAA